MGGEGSVLPRPDGRTGFIFEFTLLCDEVVVGGSPSPAATGQAASLRGPAHLSDDEVVSLQVLQPTTGSADVRLRRSDPTGLPGSAVDDLGLRDSRHAGAEWSADSHRGPATTSPESDGDMWSMGSHGALSRSEWELGAARSREQGGLPASVAGEGRDARM